MQQRNIQLFNVVPTVPPKLEFLEKLSRNLWWCWNPDAIELFRRIDPNLWRATGHNPLDFLSHISQARLEELAGDSGYLKHLEEVQRRFAVECSGGLVERLAAGERRCIAYFSMEYGIHESVGFYSGGLGVLAGDHLKAASDMNLPLVAVGLLYREGYLHQSLNADGWQQEQSAPNEVYRLPLHEVRDASSHEPLRVTVPLQDGEMKAVVWQLDVGRVPIYLLDTNIPENPPEIRAITGRLYSGERKVRLRQELLLGIGGFRALVALGYEPQVCHINEGHAAFLSLARIAHLMKTQELDLDTAFEVVSRSNVFTTHTPVPVGNETFTHDVASPDLRALERELAISVDQVIAWSKPDSVANSHEISMTVLGLRTAHFSNGVSRLHGEVARRMWQHLWPGKAEDEVPITHITNGIHVASWLSPENAPLYDRYLGPGWREHPGRPEVLAQIDHIPNEELWRAHELARARLVRTTRELAEKQLSARNVSRKEIAFARTALDQNVLTIGFARRFASYKRAALLLRDPARLEALLTDSARPIQIIFAGKAHPNDNQAKELIRQIVQFTQRPNVRSKVIFVENYDIYMARVLVQGADVWLNTPRRPLEACGTSGMKAALNGVLNVSTLDGWWCEGYAKECGWAIGHGDEYDDAEYQDSVEAQALYNLLEEEIIPLFYDRPYGDLPEQWIRMMKASIRMVLSSFTAHRMLAEYNSFFYTRAFAEYESLSAEKARRARELVEQRRRLAALWNQVRMST
ncbi:MAG: alpha-glucan family phosphorylase, partial [Kiritimatiellia bacterium]